MQQALNTLANVALLVVVPLAISATWQRRRHGRTMREISQRAGLQLGDLATIGYCAGFAALAGAAFFLSRPSLEVITRAGTVQARFAGADITLDSLSTAFLYSYIQTGFTEEFFFRGLIAGSLGRRMSLWWANVVQSMIFLAPHLLLLLIAPEHWFLLVLIFLAALLVGWARIKSESIAGPWLIHGSVNFTVTMYVLLNTPGT